MGRQLGRVVRKREGVFDIIVLMDNKWSRFGSAESGNYGNLDCGDTFLVASSSSLCRYRRFGLEGGC
jgi:hypothetical protein